jgi:uncharacterized protein involved in cysteine biosynthesis
MIKWPASLALSIKPLVRAIGQLDDPIFLGVVVRSVAWSVVCFAALHVATLWMVHQLLHVHGPAAWAADILGSVGASLLAFWLFLPVATAIGTFYFDRIAWAVERRFFPWMPAPRGAPAMEQLTDSVVVGFKVLLLNIVALVIALFFAGIGIGFLFGWMISAYAIGRGLFVAVAMRRMPRNLAESLYRARRTSVLLVGAALAAVSYVPLLNLLIPVIGTAAMVHVLDSAVSSAGGNVGTFGDSNETAY